MNKFTIFETYTPHNRKQNRNTSEYSFTSELDPSKLELVHVHAALNAIGHKDFCDEIGQLDIEETGDGIAFTINTDSGEYYYEINLDSEVTPYSKEAMVAWAEEQVTLNPTYNDSQWDDEKKKSIDVTLTNTVERELGTVLTAFDTQVYCEEKQSRLLEVITDLLRDGCKGYKNMTRDELLTEIDEQIAGPMGCETIQDVMEVCGGLEEDEDDE